MNAIVLVIIGIAILYGLSKLDFVFNYLTGKFLNIKAKGYEKTGGLFLIVVVFISVNVIIIGFVLGADLLQFLYHTILK